MLIEKTEHFFGDAVDLENIITSEMVTIPISLYRELSRTMFDDKIFQTVAALH